MFGNSFRNNQLGASRRGQNSGNGARIQVAGMGVGTQYEAGVRDVFRRERGIDSPWMARAKRIGEIWVDVEDAIAVLQDESAVAEPPEGRRITAGVLDFLE